MTAPKCAATRQGAIDPSVIHQCSRKATHGEWCRQHAESLGGWRLQPGRLQPPAALAPTPPDAPAVRGDALWRDPAPRTPEGRRLWDRLCAAPRGSDDSFRRDVGQRICQIENEAAATPTPPDALDVERLARAIGMTKGTTADDIVETTAGDVSALDYPEEWYDTARSLARDIAREYAALAETQP